MTGLTTTTTDSWRSKRHQRSENLAAMRRSKGIWHYIHRCGCGGSSFETNDLPSAHIAKVTVSDGKTEVQFQDQKTINIRPVVQTRPRPKFFIMRLHCDRRFFPLLKPTQTMKLCLFPTSLLCLAFSSLICVAESRYATLSVGTESNRPNHPSRFRSRPARLVILKLSFSLMVAKSSFSTSSTTKTFKAAIFVPLIISSKTHRGNRASLHLP